ncbi:hypothetical protein CIB93_30575 [Streptomyces sp. WZ.A104]|uniref:L,D-transpeptidase family protein n=1 Tax=Streptomyces sp. WZ.A104 TaxID=2023771 RepID=UPI000BBBA04F|nr:L,D-transpeptidase family protein [Streptomyces sp. WZ.A104]PCG82320.1 hypothetical protein CIB93_30575 [Streptomyces sp. WZ.A104]
MTGQTFRTHFATRLAPAALAVVVLGGGVSVASVQPADAAPSVAAKAKGKNKSPKTYLKFVKNKKSPTNSKLHLMQIRKGKDKSLVSWRAGSGNGSKDACKSNAGWLPNGSYKIEFRKKNFNGSAIKGYVIKLTDKKCSKGTKRTELFIHSEMKSNGKQGPKKGKDSPWRWEGNHDYKSAGCIKLKPAHIKTLFNRATANGWPKTLKVG